MITSAKRVPVKEKAPRPKEHRDDSHPHVSIAVIERGKFYTLPQIAEYLGGVSFDEIVRKYLTPQIWKSKLAFRGEYIISGTSICEWVDGDHE